MVRRRPALSRTLDGLPVALLLCRADGVPLHPNRALREVLEREPGRERLWRALEEFTRALAARCGSGRAWGTAVSVRVGRRRYRLRGSRLDGARGPGGTRLCIAVERLRGRRPAARVLQHRLGLTPRQAQVAVLLGARRTNREIAEALSISPNTALRHTEQVLSKLRVGSRLEVRRALQRALRGPRRK